ncbi:hypothetical protein L3Q82_007946 [Scortum barcoo]|uniref:Uncharacterized protein n=1 Tax=Scortum barcoo TaxID=214431 RepID=A0ACB8WKD1_9TELE|nr:hypothetical protein L3Q82_007946 [Scortum barcoo]
MEQRKVCDRWRNDEVRALLSIYGEEDIQREFERSTRNNWVYLKISDRLRELNIIHTGKQCRDKLKKLKQDYRRIKNHNVRNGSNCWTSKWFDRLDAVLGHRPAFSGADTKHPADASLEVTVDDTEMDEQPGEVRARWVEAVRRTEGPSFNILRGSTYVCREHFKPEDFYTSPGGRIRIKQGAVPSKFLWNDWGKAFGSMKNDPEMYHDNPGGGSQVHAKRTRKRMSTVVPGDSQEMLPEDITEEALLTGAALKDHDYACHPSTGELEDASQRIQQLELQVLSLQSEIQQLAVKKQQQPLVFKLERWSKAQRTAQEMAIPHKKLPLIDEFFMFLCRVAAGLQEKTLSSIFEVSFSTVSRIIVTWTRYLYQILGSLPLWMTREQVQATTPENLQLYCPAVRLVLDCTEIHCEAASSLSQQSEIFSNCKNHTTFKGLIGVAPCGAITFVSKLYTASFSDTAMTQKSQILQLLQPGDGVMASRSFLIKKMLSEVGATLITPSLKKSTEVSVEDAQKTEAIARLRVLAERAVRRVKEYCILDGPVPLSMAGSVNELWLICCVMSNYQEPLIIKGDKSTSL